MPGAYIVPPANIPCSAWGESGQPAEMGSIGHRRNLAYLGEGSRKTGGLLWHVFLSLISVHKCSRINGNMQ